MPAPAPKLSATVSKTLWSLVRTSRQLWPRVTGMALLAVVAAAVAPQLAPFVPRDLAERIDPASVRTLLNILASSMLAVTTFSLSVMVSSHQAAAANATPRSHRLLLEDTTTTTVLATFLGAFVFALTALILVEARLAADGGHVVIFAMTVLVVLLVVGAMLRWIEHLSALGTLADATRAVEDAARKALAARMETPLLGAVAWDGDPPQGAASVLAERSGHVRHVDMRRLEDAAADAGVTLWLSAPTGRHVLAGEALARASGAVDAEAVRAAFSIGDLRSYEQDPRFGLIVLSEIASRALSPGINDPGTAIDVVDRLSALFLIFRDEAAEAPGGEPAFPHLRVAPLDPAEMLRETFGPVARDGAGIVEVQVRVQKALGKLVLLGSPGLSAAARAIARDARDRALGALTQETDARRVAEAAAFLGR